MGVLACTGGPAILVLDLTGWISPDPLPGLQLDVKDHDDLDLLVTALATAATRTPL